jgi:hypothetical protein
VEQKTPSRHPHNPWILLKPPILIRENLSGEDQTSDYCKDDVLKYIFDLGVCAPFFQTNETQNLLKLPPTGGTYPTGTSDNKEQHDHWIHRLEDEREE